MAKNSRADLTAEVIVDLVYQLLGRVALDRNEVSVATLDSDPAVLVAIAVGPCAEETRAVLEGAAKKVRRGDLAIPAAEIKTSGLPS